MTNKNTQHKAAVKCTPRNSSHRPAQTRPSLLYCTELSPKFQSSLSSKHPRVVDQSPRVNRRGRVSPLPPSCAPESPGAPSPSLKRRFGPCGVGVSGSPSGEPQFDSYSYLYQGDSSRQGLSRGFDTTPLCHDVVVSWVRIGAEGISN